MRRLLPIVIVLLCGACAEDRGRGRVVGSLMVPECDGDGALDARCAAGVDPLECEAFDLEVDFFAVETFEESAVIRVQRGGLAFAQTNGVLLEIRDVRLLRGELGRPLAVGPERNIRAALGLFDRCPDATQNFELRGEVTFTAFGVGKGDAVQGRIDRLEVRDGRSEGPGTVLGVLHGDFDFTLRRGPPYQQFAGK
ncbi:MAG: hypothetical protein H6704_17445 [Myxococcales bacterium]|nr:hypothetical protein [Myxococcales bacterium]